jgi:hypothetical protein
MDNGQPVADAKVSGPQCVLSEVRRLAENITGKNWHEKKAALLALLETEGKL